MSCREGKERLGKLHLPSGKIWGVGGAAPVGLGRAGKGGHTGVKKSGETGQRGRSKGPWGEPQGGG